MGFVFLIIALVILGLATLAAFVMAALNLI